MTTTTASATKFATIKAGEIKPGQQLTGIFMDNGTVAKFGPLTVTKITDGRVHGQVPNGTHASFQPDFDALYEIQFTTATTQEIKNRDKVTGFLFDDGTVYKFDTAMEVMGICITQDGTKHIHYRTEETGRTEIRTYEMESDVIWQIECR